MEKVSQLHKSQNYADKRMKILMVEPFQTMGGEEQVVLSLIRHLDHSLFDIELICNSEGPLVEDLKRLGIPLHFVDIYGKWNWNAVPKIYRIMKRGSFHLIHGHNSFAGLFTRIAVRLHGRTPIVWTDHLLPHQHHRWTMKSRFLSSLYTIPFSFLERLTDQIVFVSQSALEMRRNINPAPRISTIVIRNGVSIDYNEFQKRRVEFRREIGASPDTFLLGNVTRLKWQKGVDCFLKAMKILFPQFENMMGVVVGEGPDEREFHRMAEDLGLGDKLKFIGPVQDITGVVPGFDIAVLPSLFEGLSITLLEYMAGGLPIIASDIPNNREVIGDNEAGMLFKVGDETALAEAIVSLYKQPEIRQKLASEAKIRYLERFTVDTMVSRYSQLYLELADS